MALSTLPAAELCARLDAFSAVIDARSPSEWQLDHLPGAANWPVLNDEERVRVGTLYAQVSPFEAQKVGAALVARNIAQHIEAHTGALDKGWLPLVYCWRGGKRSGALAHVLSQIGFKVTLLEGGYKAFRAQVVKDLDTLPLPLQWRVLCGPTGSGKSLLLRGLQDAGHQVVDLEALANHKGSILGLTPGERQPSQKAFESALWQVLRRLDPSRPVFVESESARVGQLRVPLTLLAQMRAAPCIHLAVPLEDRVALLFRDYQHFVHDQAMLSRRLEALTDMQGKAVVKRWQAMLAEGDVVAVVRALLAEHYDPYYKSSLARNFGRQAPGQRELNWRARPQDLDDAIPALLSQVQTACDATQAQPSP